MKRRKTGPVLKEWSLLTTKLSCSYFIFLLSFFAFVKSAYDDWEYQNYIQALAYSAKLIIRPDSSTVLVDTRISFFCRADGNPLPTVVWKKNGLSVSDLRYSTKTLSNGLSTLRIEPVRLSDANSTISCTADNGIGNPVIADAILTVLPSDELPAGFPVIEAHPILKSVEQGRTAHLSCRVRGHPRPKVLWLRDLMPVDIRSNTRYSVSTLGNPGALMIQQAKEEDQGKYECVARNAHGVTHSKAAHLYVKVRRVPPYFSYKLERLYKTALGGALNLTCVAVGYPMPRVFWKKSDDTYLNDPQAAPIGRNVLTLTRIEKTENYTCVAVSKLGNIEAMTTVEVKSLPHAPQNLQLSDVTSNSVRISWDPVYIKEEPVKKYIIKYRQKSAAILSTPIFPANDIEYDEGSFKQKEVSANVTSTVITDLEPYQLYEIAILSVNVIGRSAASMPKEVQTDETKPGSAPQKVQARVLSRSSILVRWEPPEKPNGQITGYVVHYTNLEPNTTYHLWKTRETKSDELIVTITNLEFESVYYIHVQAKNAKGLGPMSQLATVITKQGIPEQPAGLTAKVLDSHRIQLTWEKPLHSYNIIGYSIHFNASNGSSRELMLTIPIEKHIIDGLLPDTSYSFRVAARSARGIGAFCADVTVKTHQNVPTVAPKILMLKALSSHSLFIRWKAPLIEYNKGKILNYLIRWRPILAKNETDRSKIWRSDEDDEESLSGKSEKSEKRWLEIIQDAVLGDSAIIKGLNPHTIYEVSVAAGTDIGYGPGSEPEQEKTDEDESDVAAQHRPGKQLHNHLNIVTV
ncbi:Tyrosine-protein phosphatase Lar-like [Dirofilaria immitis]